MDEFRSKQTNPYSNQPEPTQQISFSPTPEVETPAETPFSPAHTFSSTPEPAPAITPEVTFEPLPPPPPPQPIDQPVPRPVAEPAPQPMPQPVPQPEPAPIEQAPFQPDIPLQPQSQDFVQQPQAKAKKSLPKALLIIPIVLLVISLLGGAFFLYNKQVSKLESDLSATKEEAANLKSSKFGSTNGQGLTLSGGGESQGEVAGENTEASIVEDFVYTAQVVTRDGQLLIEGYVDTKSTGKIESVWINYGGNKSSLTLQTEKTTEGISESTEGITQVIATADLGQFEDGSSYMFRMSVKGENGKIYKSGYSVFSLPKVDDTAPSPEDSGL